MTRPEDPQTGHAGRGPSDPPMLWYIGFRSARSSECTAETSLPRSAEETR